MRFRSPMRPTGVEGAGADRRRRKDVGSTGTSVSPHDLERTARASLGWAEEWGSVHIACRGSDGEPGTWHAVAVARENRRADVMVELNFTFTGSTAHVDYLEVREDLR